jgi:hypothetical protein
MFTKLEKPRTVKVTRSLVNEFVNMDRLPRDRDLSERRLMVYRRVLNAGEFRPVTWASAACAETGSTYRVNGKHTSLMLSELPHLPEDFFVTVERYSCPTLEDVARLYATFDSRESTRTTKEIVNSFASTVTEFAGLNRSIFALVVAAASYHKWGQNYASEHPVAERAELLLDHVDFAAWANGILFPADGEAKRSAHLRRAAVVAAMLVTWTKAKKAADEFWSHVRDEDDADRDGASRVLARFLTRVGAKSDFALKGKKMVTFREMYVRCLHGWNAWRKGEDTKLIYYPVAKVPAIQ